VPFLIREFEWYGAELGLKPVINVEYGEREFAGFEPNIKEIEKCGLRVTVRDVGREPFAPLEANPRSMSRRSGRQVFISRKKEHAERMIRAYEAGDYRAIGLLLGYPSCCVDRYLRRIGRGTDPHLLVSNSAFLAEQRRIPSALPAEANFLAHYDGRIKDSRVLKDPLFKSIFFGLFPWAMADHLPCSLGCSRSLRRGRLITAAIRRYNPEWYAAAARLNGNPVLYLDDFRFYVLEAGSCRPDGLDYRSVVFATETKSPLYRLLRRSDSLRLGAREIACYAKGAKTGAAALARDSAGNRPRLLPFLA